MQYIFNRVFWYIYIYYVKISEQSENVMTLWDWWWHSRNIIHVHHFVQKNHFIVSFFRLNCTILNNFIFGFELDFIFELIYLIIYIHIYKQYNPETARRNMPKPKHSFQLNKRSTNHNGIANLLLTSYNFSNKKEILFTVS